jgi:hypothetical protein
MDIYTKLAEQIIKEQATIIGPVAWEQAVKVQGITLDPQTKAITLEGDKKAVIENLVKQYEGLFGKISIEVCRHAVKDLISETPKDEVPQILL